MVPANVTIAGTPIGAPMPVQQQIESDVSLPVTNAGGLWQSTYVTGRMAVPLEFNDILPHATYTAGFTADIYGQVSGDPNWANNVYNYPGYFSFLSLESQDREGPFVIERVRKRST